MLGYPTLYHLAVFTSLTYLKGKESKNSEMSHYPIDHSRYQLTHRVKLHEWPSIRKQSLPWPFLSDGLCDPYQSTEDCSCSLIEQRNAAPPSPPLSISWLNSRFSCLATRIVHFYINSNYRDLAQWQSICLANMRLWVWFIVTTTKIKLFLKTKL